jgi:hypothetical protein
MRRLFAPGLLGLGATSLAACLLTVDESLVERDPTAPEAGTDAPLEPAADADADAGADASPLVDRGCAGFSLGNYCGRSLDHYQGNAQDLVRCLGDGGMGEAVRCATGCVPMPSGRRDICNPCVGTPNGAYCVNQLVADYNTTDVRIACSADMLTTSGVNAPKICPNGCGTAGSFGDCL